MPLPHRGVGGTLAGGSPGGRAGATAHQETLFGLSPEKMFGERAARPQALAPQPQGPQRAPAAQVPVVPGPAPRRTAFGAPAAAGERPITNEAPSPAGAVPLQADSPAPHRTLLGVMPGDLARAVAVARDKAATPSPPPRAPSPAPMHASEPIRRANVAGVGWEPARGATAVPSPAPQHTVLEQQRPLPAVREEQGTVRSIGSEPAPRLATERLTPERLGDGAQHGEPAAPNPGLPMHARTALGVAIPGIAPLRAGASNPAPAPRPQTRLEETRLQPDSMSAPPVSLRAPMPRGAYVLLGSGLILLILAVAFALLWKAKKPLSVASSVDDGGLDRIDILCEECPDGTLVSLPSGNASISSRKAYLTLSEALPLGESRVTFGLQYPGEPEARSVELTLPPVEYRIRANPTTLVGDEPRLTLEISALAGSKVEIAGQPVALDTNGHGEISVDLGGQLIGAASDVVTFEQAIAYSITPPSGKVYAGELATKIGVTPLLLEAPGLDTITDLERFMLAGRTSKGAELWVAGTAIAVDSQGRFAQLMSIDSVGETRVTLRATAAGLAPRFVSFRLQRVHSLENEAAARRRAARPLADVAVSIADHVGSTVVVSGRIEEVRVDGHRTLIVLSDSQCQGRTCLARLVYGGLRKLARGEVITAIGRLQGAVGSAGGDVPEVDVSLLL